MIDIDWLWAVTERDLPIGLEHIANYQGRFFVVVTNAKTGQADYLSPTSAELFMAIKASSSLPFAYRGNVTLRGKTWLDGGIADSLPVKQAYQRGVRNMLVLRSNPVDYVKKPYRFLPLFRHLLKDYPAVLECLKTRYQAYNAALDFIRNPPPDCQITEVCPPKSLKLSQLNTHLTTLDNAYQAGLQQGQVLLDKTLCNSL